MADFSNSLKKIVLGTVSGIGDVGGGAGADRLPRIRPRPARHAHPRRRPGPQDLHHPPRAGPRRHLPVAQAERYSYSVQYLGGRITGALGGRAAEEVVYGQVTTGAENDMEHASNIARQMVGRWGHVAGDRAGLPQPGQESPYGLDGVVPAARELVDTQACKIIEECYERAVATPRGGRDRLDRLSHALLERETLEEDEAYAAAGIERDTAVPSVAAQAIPDRGPSAI